MDHLPGEQAALFVLAYHWCKKLHSVLGLGSDTPVRPIPYLHAPPEPTWWRPSEYLPPPSSSHEIVSQVHYAVNAALSHATQEWLIRCEKTLKESIFQGLAALLTTAAPNLLTAMQVPPGHPAVNVSS